MTQPAPLDPRELRNVLGQFCTGVVIATGCVDGKPAGFAAQSFSSVSLDPPLVLLCPAKSSTSWPKLRQAGSFCINILAADQKPVCDVFAQSGIDKFAALPWRPGVTGSPILDGVLAYVDCDLHAEHDAGDHTLVVGRVRDVRILDPEGLPLLFFRGAYGRFEGVRR
jgi:3-hydroxy-9,10-secoandrosta-1,3,5(10)-triene-9,17-dione monooxygenase reductase component